MTMTINPLQIAIQATEKSRNRCAETQVNALKPAAELAGSEAWGSTGVINMNLPIDGWNMNHWKRYFQQLFKVVYGRAYTGNPRYDTIGMSQFLFQTRIELKMSNQEIHDCLDFIARKGMVRFRDRGQIFLISMLKDEVNDFFNEEVHHRINADKNARIKRRDLPLDNTDFRVAISEYIIRNEDGKVKDFDVRLLIQLGIPNIVQYLSTQEEMAMDEIGNLLFPMVQQMISEDIEKHGLSPFKESPRFERMIRNSIAWEPYPWKMIPWRTNALRPFIEVFQLHKKPWWREDANTFSKSAPCLTKLKTKKRK